MRNQVIADLEKTKTEVQENLYITEQSLGHTILSKADKGLAKEDIDTYKSYNTDVETFLKLQQDILQLDAELKEQKTETDNQKELLSIAKKQLPLLYKQLGAALFVNYSPIYADCFGQAYTNACIEDLKIAEAQTKEEGYRENSGKKNFFVKMVSHAKVGVAKTQIATLQQKKDSIILQGAKVAGNSGLLEVLLQKEQLDEGVKSAFLEFTAVNNQIKDITTSIEKLTLTANELKKSLDTAGVTFTVARRIANLDSQIEQKKDEQNTFSARIGHEFGNKYVTPTGEKITDFPRYVKEDLSSIQDQKETIIVLGRSIEIEKTKLDIEKVQEEIVSLNKSKDSNNERIERLQAENEEILNRVEEKSLIEKDLAEKLEDLLEEALSNQKTEKVLSIEE